MLEKNAEHSLARKKLLWEFQLVFGIVKRKNLLNRKKTNIAEFSQFVELKIFEEYLFKIYVNGKHKTKEKKRKKNNFG